MSAQHMQIRQGSPVTAEQLLEQAASVVHDPRLTWPEREILRQLGVKLYGQPGVTSDG
jgi:hypothetical protein